VQHVAEIVSAEIARSGTMGVRVDTSTMLTKTLELEGISCYAAKGPRDQESYVLFAAYNAAAGASPADWRLG